MVSLVCGDAGIAKATQTDRIISKNLNREEDFAFEAAGVTAL